MHGEQRALMAAWTRHYLRQATIAGEGRVAALRDVIALFARADLARDMPKWDHPIDASAFELGRLAGRTSDAWAGECPFEQDRQPAQRWSWMEGFSQGRIEARRGGGWGAAT